MSCREAGGRRAADGDVLLRLQLWLALYMLVTLGSEAVAEVGLGSRGAESMELGIEMDF